MKNLRGAFPSFSCMKSSFVAFYVEAIFVNVVTQCWFGGSRGKEVGNQDLSFLAVPSHVDQKTTRLYVLIRESDYNQTYRLCLESNLASNKIYTNISRSKETFITPPISRSFLFIWRNQLNNESSVHVDVSRLALLGVEWHLYMNSYFLGWRWGKRKEASSFTLLFILTNMCPHQQ